MTYDKEDLTIPGNGPVTDYYDGYYNSD